MKYFIPLLLIAILMSSCIKEVELHGAWITVSSFNKGEEPRAKHAQLIYDFEADSVSIVQLGNHASGDYGEISIDKLAYEVSNDLISIYSKNDSLSFDYTLQDSLILSFYIEEQDVYRSTILKRIDLNKNLHQTPKGSYKFSWPEGSGNICFVNDSVCIGLNENRAVKWKVFNYKGANLFMYQDGMTPVASIWNHNQDTLNLRYHLNPNRKVTLTKSDTRIVKDDFFGEWLKYQSGSEFPPPPPPLDSNNFELYMSINKDSLSIHYYNGTKTKYWKLTNDASHIYFPNHLLTKGDSWKIENISKDSLVFKTDYRQKTKWYRKDTTGNTVYSK
jgi:hypothetical protein